MCNVHDVTHPHRESRDRSGSDVLPGSDVVNAILREVTFHREVTFAAWFFGKWRSYQEVTFCTGSWVQRTKTGFFRGTKIETRMRALFRIFVPRPIGGIPRKKVGRNYKLFKKEQKKNYIPLSLLIPTWKFKFGWCDGMFFVFRPKVRIKWWCLF